MGDNQEACIITQPLPKEQEISAQASKVWAEGS